jgi:hypothetical protein
MYSGLLQQYNCVKKRNKKEIEVHYIDSKNSLVLSSLSMSAIFVLIKLVLTSKSNSKALLFTNKEQYLSI